MIRTRLALLGLLALAIVAPSVAHAAGTAPKIQTRSYTLPSRKIGKKAPAAKKQDDPPLVSIQAPSGDDLPELGEPRPMNAKGPRKSPPMEGDAGQTPPVGTQHRNAPETGPAFELKLVRAPATREALSLRPGNYNVGLPNGAVRAITVHGPVGGNQSAVEILKPAELMLFSGEIIQAGDQYFALLAYRVAPREMGHRSLTPSGFNPEEDERMVPVSDPGAAAPMQQPERRASANGRG